MAPETCAAAGRGVPAELRLRRGGRVLELVWADGTSQALAAPALRAACRCAECGGARRAGRAPAIAADLSLVDVRPYGPSGVNLHFSDGHRRGIFPFVYLASLAGEAQTPAAACA